MDLYNDDTCPSGHISRPTQVDHNPGMLMQGVTTMKLQQPQDTQLRKYENHGKGSYFRFDDDNNMS